MIKSVKLKQIKIRLLGYKGIIKDHGLEYLREIRTKLVETPITKKKISNWTSLSRDSGTTFELSLQQFFCSFALHDNSKLLHEITKSYQSKKYIRTHIPPAWQEQLIKKGIPVAIIDCTVRWFFYCFYRLLRNIFVDFTYILSLTCKKNHPFLENVDAFFLDISLNNLPKRCADGSASKTIMDWIINNEVIQPGKSQYIYAHSIDTADYIMGKVQIKYSQPMWMLISGYKKKINFICLWISEAIHATVNLFFFKWEFALLLSEQTRALAIDFVEDNNLPKAVFIPFFASPYKPLWTYKVEARGSKIHLYFPSYSLHPLMNTGTDHWNMKLATWRSIFVWNSLMSDSLYLQFSDKLMKLPVVRVVEPIWFSDNPKISAPEYDSNIIAVFPVDQIRPSIYLGLSTTAEWSYRFPDLYTKFGEDIIKVLEENGLFAAWKEKRNAVSGWNKKNSSLFRNKLQKNKRAIFIDANLSPLRLINSCRASISFPFTSTAVLAQHEGRIAVYYDPTGWISSHDPASNGILTLVGIESLRSWVKKLSLNEL